MYSLLLTASLVSAPPTPPSKFAPVLALKVVAPDGVRVTLRPGTPNAVVNPATIGLRPGYFFRLHLDNLPDEPGTVIDPSIEVRSSLFMPINLKPEDFPAPLTITVDDIRRVVAGGMVTKVITIEDPDKAAPEATTPEKPLERDVGPREDPIEVGCKTGRVLAVVRLGGRTLTQEELARHDIPGTAFALGEPLSPPAVAPTLPGKNYQYWDPISGPRIPTEELINDGGDIGPRIGIGYDGHLGNVDATDTAVEYRSGQTKRTTVSNRICLFAPRFIVWRQELIPVGYHLVHPPLIAEVTLAPNITRVNWPSLVVDNRVSPAILLQRLMVRGTHSRTGQHELELFQGGPLVVAMVEGLAVVGTVVEPQTLTQYRDQCKPEEPLVLVKVAEPREAQPGDIVTITIRFINYGRRPAREMIVADSLSPRLEYVPGSSRGDRPTTFTQQANEAGSVILKWEVAGELAPGQSGTVQFQAKVR